MVGSNSGKKSANETINSCTLLYIHSQSPSITNYNFIPPTAAPRD